MVKEVFPMKLNELIAKLQEADPENLDPEVKMVGDSFVYEIEYVNPASKITPEVYLFWA